jgi:hypothetical protein
MEGSPRDLFGQVERMTNLGIAVPQLAQVGFGINRRLGTAFDFLTVDEAHEALAVSLG